MRQYIDLFSNRVRRLITRPTEEMSRAEQAVRYAVDLGRYCARELREDRASTMAAALTYHTLFSILPTIVLILLVLKMFVGPAEQEWFKDNAVEQIIGWLEPEPPASELDQPAIEDPGQAPADETTDRAAAGLAKAAEGIAEAEQAVADATAQNGGAPQDAESPEEQLSEAERGRREFQQARTQLSENLQYYIDQLQQVNFSSIGVVGVIVFLYGATGLLATIERSFNHIYRASAARSIFMRLPLYYFVITLAPLLILAGQYAQSRFIGLLESGAWTNWLTGPLVVISPLATFWLVLSLMYALLPNTWVSPRAAAIGGLVSAIGWAAAILGFRMYVQTAAGASLYGALALLPLFLLWLYLMWLIVLFGLEITFTLQTLPGKRLHERKLQEQQPPVNGQLLLPCMTIIAEAFRHAEPVETHDIANRLRTPARELDELLSLLQQHHLINAVQREDHDGPAFTLARPADEIGLSALLDLRDEVSTLTGPDAEPIPGSATIGRLRDAQRRAIGSATLADAIAENAAAAADSAGATPSA